MFSGFFSKAPNVEIVINEIPKRKRSKLYDKNNDAIVLPFFKEKEDITGKIVMNRDTGSSFEHKGIRIEMMGMIESVKEKKEKDSVVFVHVTNEIEMPGTLNKKDYSWEFTFANAQLQYETYLGKVKNIRYILRVSIDTSFKTYTFDKEFAVRKYEPLSVIPSNNPFKLEIGFEDWLLLNFEFKQMDFGLKDTVEGVVTFKNVNLRMTTLELQILRQEISLTDNIKQIDTVGTYQIMDGEPKTNETLVIRFPLKQLYLSPSYQNINNNRFAVQYFMFILLIDNDDRKFTKQFEIFMHRIDRHMKDVI